MLTRLRLRDQTERRRRVVWFTEEWRALLWSVEDISDYESRLVARGLTLSDGLVEDRRSARERMRQIAYDMIIYKRWPVWLWRLGIWWHYRDYIVVARIPR